MSSATDLVRLAGDRLASQYAVNLNFDDVLNAISAAPPDGAQAGALLDRHVKALRSAAIDLDRLRAKIVLYVEDLPFTEAGWQSRRPELEGLLSTNPEEGIAEWFGDWSTAAAAGRVDALGRLCTEIDLPPKWNTLRDRCATSTAGIERANWELAAPALTAAATGLPLGEHPVAPSEETRGRLWLLLARLALRGGRLEEASAALQAGSSEASAASVEALHARLARLRQEGDEAERRLRAAGALDPANFDVAIELIESAEDESLDEFGLEAARFAMSTLPSSAEGERELRRLLGDAPAALWLALIERALAEREFERCEWAAEQAEDGTAAEPILASIAEMRAIAARERRAPIERLAALADAGSHWLAADRAERAVPVLEEALSVEPGHEQAALHLADAMIATSDSPSLAETRERAGRALDLIAGTRERHGVSAQGAWGYLVESEAHRLLAEAGEERHDWSALGSACRGVAHAGHLSVYWAIMAAAANGLSLPATCETFARHAVAMNPDDVQARGQLAMALTNAGKLSEVDEYLTGDERTWAQCVRAFSAVRNGDPEAAVRLLLSLDAPPRKYWVTDTMIDSLILCGRGDEAQLEAERALAFYEDRLEELESRRVAAHCQMVLGRYGEAEKLLEPILREEVEYDPVSQHGRIQLLRGDAEAGLKTLLHSIDLAERLALEEWDPVTEPVLVALATQASIRLPELASVRAAIAARREELRGPEDPLAEVAAAACGGSDPRLVENTKSMAIAALHTVLGTPEMALAPLEAALERAPRDVELSLLLARARAAVDTVEPPRPLDKDGGGTSHLAPTLELALPPTWFSNHPDPLSTHPLFLRYIPEMRIRAGWEVPGLAVTVDPELEPDRYTISIRGQETQKGRIDLRCLYLAATEVSALGLRTEDRQGGVLAALDLAAIDPAAVTGDRLGELLAMTADEVVTRHVGAIVEARADELGRSDVG